MDDVKEKEKFLGASVPEDLYWEFKGCASNRKESMQDAIIHAARLYVDIEEKETDDNG